MGEKTSVIPQLDIFRPGVPTSHRPTKLTGIKNRQVSALLKNAGIQGLTASEVETKLGWPTGTGQGRLSELKALSYARKTDAQRNGQRVYVARVPEEKKPTKVVRAQNAKRLIELE